MSPSSISFTDTGRIPGGHAGAATATCKPGTVLGAESPREQRPRGTYLPGDQRTNRGIVYSAYLAVAVRAGSALAFAGQDDFGNRVVNWVSQKQGLLQSMARHRQ